MLTVTFEAKNKALQEELKEEKNHFKNVKNQLNDEIKQKEN